MEDVYVRMFCMDAVTNAKRQKTESVGAISLGRPSFVVRRLRLSGVVVSHGSDWVALDDATGVATVLFSADVSELSIGASCEAFCHVAQGSLMVDCVRDTRFVFLLFFFLSPYSPFSNDPYADVHGMLETMDAYQDYFGARIVPEQCEGLQDAAPLSPLCVKQLNPGSVQALIAAAGSGGVSLKDLATATRAAVDAVQSCVDNLIVEGLCYYSKAKGLYLAL